ncbi:MAG: hypothetical protein PHC51_12150, partial [bacterium]|nr:hypothetical protein [bacterium]
MSVDHCVSKRWQSFLGLLVVTLLIATPVWCQDVVTLTVASGSTASTRAADDFATTVLGDPWDFSNTADLAWQENLTSISINTTNAPGLLTATAKSNSSGYSGLIYPLFEGFAERYSLLHDDLTATFPRSGLETPVNSSEYHKLSFRMKNEYRSNIRIFWNDGSSSSLEFPSAYENMATLNDKYLLSQYYSHLKTPGGEIFDLDITDIAQFDIYDGSWLNSISSIAIEPSTENTIGKTSVDWIRLYRPDPNSLLTLNFRYNGYFSNDTHIVNLYIKNTSSGSEPALVRHYFGEAPNNTNALYYYSDFQFQIDKGAFPPGTYSLYASVSECSLNGPDTDNIYPACDEKTATRSSPILITIQAPPKITIQAPSIISGPEYSERELKNRWDMNVESDLLNFSALLPLSRLGLATQAIVFSADANEGSKLYAATTGRITSGATSPLLLGDASPDNPQIHLTTKTDIAIDTYRYRFLTYRMWLPATIPLPSALEDMSDDKAMVTGPVFWNYDMSDDVGSNKPNVVRPGWNTYTVDLWDSYNGDGFDWFYDYLGVSHLRIDPVSRRDVIPFKIDWVRLNEENRPSADNKFRIEFKLSDTDSATASVQILRDEDEQFDLLDTSTWGEPIVTLSALKSGTGTTHSYVWDTSTTLEGVYYLHFVVNDGSNVVHKYSSVEVVVEEPIAPTPPPVRVPLDYDGDWLSDPVVYRPATGEYFQKLSGSQPVYYQWVKGIDFYPVEGDFDGDGQSDLALAFPFQGYI